MVRNVALNEARILVVLLSCLLKVEIIFYNKNGINNI